MISDLMQEKLREWLDQESLYKYRTRTLENDDYSLVLPETDYKSLLRDFTDEEVLEVMDKYRPYTWRRVFYKTKEEVDVDDPYKFPTKEGYYEVPRMMEDGFAEEGLCEYLLATTEDEDVKAHLLGFESAAECDEYIAKLKSIPIKQIAKEKPEVSTTDKYLHDYVGKKEIQFERWYKGKDFDKEVKHRVWLEKNDYREKVLEDKSQEQIMISRLLMRSFEEIQHDIIEPYFHYLQDFGFEEIREFIVVTKSKTWKELREAILEIEDNEDIKAHLLGYNDADDMRGRK